MPQRAEKIFDELPKIASEQLPTEVEPSKS
jgi:hypothetical protein